MKQKTYLSNKGKEAFDKFFMQWDERVETHDDLETQRHIEGMLNKIHNNLNKWCDEMKIRALEKYKNDPLKAKAEHDRVVNTQMFKDMRESAEYALYVQYTLKNVYELKNRRTAECFSLRGQLAKIKLNENNHKHN